MANYHSGRRSVTYIITFMIWVFSASLLAADSEAPTAPGNLTAVAENSTTVSLGWDPSTDNRRVKSYKLSRDGQHIATTRKTAYVDRTLQPETVYSYSLVATDGVNISIAAIFTIETPAAGATTEPDPEEPTTHPGKGRGKKNNDEPPTEEPPTEEPPTEEPPTEEPPTEPTAGVPDNWFNVFHDDFNGTGQLAVGGSSNWRYETLIDALHRAGNNGIDEFGQPVESWNSAKGKRWSAWYDGHHETTATVGNGVLRLGGLFSGESDPTRPFDYMDNNILTQYGSSKLYTAWIDTFSRKWVGPGSEHVMDPESPGKIFKYGYFETRVNFSEMMTPGFRLSFWLMPASTDSAGQNLVVSGAYDDNGDNGVEIDIFEYEWLNSEYANRIQMGVHGGGAGSSSTALDLSDLNINLHEGFHTIGFLWEQDKMIWSVDGYVVKEIFNTNLIPDVYSYVILSREMNSGIKNSAIDNIEAGDVLEDWPYRPRDPGMFAQNIWEFKDRINTDSAIVDYVSIWQP